VSDVIDYRKVFEAVVSDSRYLANLDWGEARPGHPEGTVRAHIAELEQNLGRLRDRLSEEEYWKLRVLVHVHDSFKADAKRGAAIADPRSHASLARAFLAEFCEDGDLLAMVQWHDEPFALYRGFCARGSCDAERLERLLGAILDWDLFLGFCLVDGCTEEKPREGLRWFLGVMSGRVESRFSEVDVIE
jgi:hypothetical protein